MQKIAALECPPPALPQQPGPQLLTAALASTSLLMSACGGGGGGGGSTDPAPAPTPAPTPPPPSPSDAEACRFLAQAGFAATAADMATVKTQGYAAWLDAQMALPVSSPHFDWMLAKGYGALDYRNNFAGVDSSLWRKLISAPDGLRQRLVLALSEIFVISMAGLPVAWRGMAVAAYVDMLEQRCFGSFRDLLEGVTLSCGMGVYLNLRGNQKEDAKTGRLPDENYARELMQLFTIGLIELKLDGSPVLDGQGKPKETYTQTNITELARVFTGWDFDDASATDPSFMRKPMVHNAAKFSSGDKKVLDVSIAASLSGPQAMKLVLDTLANHPNVGPFFGRQLIQRLVCSNPSPAYVQRVASVFNDNGAGQRGDLKALLKAVLLDAEARSLPSGNGAGKLREPMQRFIQWARSFGASSATELWNIGDTSNPATRLGQSPLRSPSVFNFFRPGYVPPNSVLGSQGITAPEFQLCNESTVAGYLNFMQTAIANGVGEVKASYSAELAKAGDAKALVDDLALRLSGNTLSSSTLTSIATAVASINASSDAGKLNRVCAAILMVMACPEYLIQK
ncbi:uncharacterized protein (DUF1800 family) [Paucibacter oligotrophus]|uniref:Uncharacterized protein (DUF1800 family) n=1 Tax=Roseateles oligotrophus TaxID=1769250 RepID=A0A840L738_9BURK|nr:DUF1800 domain-containing protein [Roseateles oligotrophus]MBB4842465.1 uncharacterized protein (DUF1800 family) [Roseateles oligotrophus]